MRTRAPLLRAISQTKDSKMKYAIAIAALMLWATSASAGSPWTEADGEDVVFFALKKVICSDSVTYIVWVPYNTALNKQLDFLRITSDADAPIKGITLSGNNVLLNGVRCTDGRPEIIWRGKFADNHA
jgi:hypothetical protein